MVGVSSGKYPLRTRRRVRSRRSLTSVSAATVYSQKRQQDELGIAYAYTDLSDVLKDNLDLLQLGGRLRVEHQIELLYNVHLTPWLQLTGDLQILSPNRPAADTAIVPGPRVRVVF